MLICLRNICFINLLAILLFYLIFCRYEAWNTWKEKLLIELQKVGTWLT